MQIAADSVTIDHTLAAILPVVAPSDSDGTDRLSVSLEVGQTGVVLESDQLAPL